MTSLGQMLNEVSSVGRVRETNLLTLATLFDLYRGPWAKARTTCDG